MKLKIYFIYLSKILLLLIAFNTALHAQQTSNFDAYERAYNEARTYANPLRNGDFSFFDKAKKENGDYLEPRLKMYVNDLKDSTLSISSWHYIIKSEAEGFYYYQEVVFDKSKTNKIYYYYIIAIMIFDNGESSTVRSKILSLDENAFDAWWLVNYKRCREKEFKSIPKKYNIRECPPRPQ